MSAAIDQARAAVAEKRADAKRLLGLANKWNAYALDEAEAASISGGTAFNSAASLMQMFKVADELRSQSRSLDYAADMEDPDQETPF